MTLVPGLRWPGLKSLVSALNEGSAVGISDELAVSLFSTEAVSNPASS